MGVAKKCGKQEKVEPILEKIKKLDAVKEEVGIRAFVWEVQMSI